jgi:hypothetical protein
MQISRSLKRITVIAFSIIAVLALLLYISDISSRPPKERKIIEGFYAHRAAYEQLRNMLIVDKELTDVADWGVRTADSPLSKMPPEGGFSVSRYHEYLALLREIGAKRAGGVSGKNATEIYILVWSSGFAGDIRHVDIAWLDHEPTNTVSSLDEFYRSPKPRSPIYRHIEGNWYIWADW